MNTDEQKNRGGNAADNALYARCVSYVRKEGRASTSLLQRHFNLGYAKAAQMMEALYEHGVVSAPRGEAKVREVLKDGE